MARAVRECIAIEHHERWQCQTIVGNNRGRCPYIGRTLIEDTHVIFGFFANDPSKEARQLGKDVVNVVGMAEQTYRPELLDDIARITRDGIAQIVTLCGDNAHYQARELDRYKTLHRDARRQNSQVGLTAYTLIIINTRATALGELGAPVCVLIEEFLQRWPAKLTDESTLAG
jgi:hypothetical protein